MAVTTGINEFFIGQRWPGKNRTWTFLATQQYKAGEILDKSDIINKHTLSFDAADKENGSLYLCVDPSIEPGTDVGLVIEALRHAGLWSSEVPKEVPDEQRAAYEEQLELVDVVAFRDADSTLLAARFNHEKYPSSGARWQAWLDTLGGKYHRC